MRRLWTAREGKKEEVSDESLSGERERTEPNRRRTFRAPRLADVDDAHAAHLVLVRVVERLDARLLDRLLQLDDGLERLGLGADKGAEMDACVRSESVEPTGGGGGARE